MSTIPEVPIDANGQPASFYYPRAKYHIPLRRRVRWAYHALRGNVEWVIWNFPDPETGEPKSLTIGGWTVPR